jgi:formylglycine-generating enzyme required for sulfatase activity
VRGGAWGFTTLHGRAACRDRGHPLERDLNLGLRVVCCPIF